MSGQSGHVRSKRPREVFLTSTSLSFSSLSSSCTSSDDTIEISCTKASRTSETLCVTHVRMEPAPSSRPVQLMNICLGTNYDPQRIPASVFAKTGGDLNWIEISSDSLFSLRMSTCQGLRQSNIKSEEGEFLAFSPSLLVEDTEEEKRSQVKEHAKSVVTTSVETNTHREKSLTSAPQVFSCSFDQLYQARQTKSQSFPPLPVGEKKKKKKKKTSKSKKKQSMWSWLCSGVSMCCCYKWRKCCCSRRELKAMVL